jgi:hypothetical protein
LTVITTPLLLSILFLLLVVRLGGYIVNLCTFYFYKVIGKLLPASVEDSVYAPISKKKTVN